MVNMHCISTSEPAKRVKNDVKPTVAPGKVDGVIGNFFQGKAGPTKAQEMRVFRPIAKH